MRRSFEENQQMTALVGIWYQKRKQQLKSVNISTTLKQAI